MTDQPSRLDPPWPDPPPPGFRHDGGDPDEAFRVPFTMLDGFGLVVWSILAQILVGGLGIGLGLDPDLPSEAVVLVVGIQIATAAGVAAWLNARGALTWRLLGPVRPRLKHLAQGVGIGLVGMLLVLTSSEATNRLFGPFDAPDQPLLDSAHAGPLAYVLLVLSTVLLAPIVEEAIFRGVLFQSTRRRLGLAAGMVISALTFAYVHVSFVSSPPAIVSLVALALWLAGAFHRTGSLVVPIVAHGTYNAIAVLAAALGSQT